MFKRVLTGVGRGTARGISRALAAAARKEYYDRINYLKEGVSKVKQTLKGVKKLMRNAQKERKDTAEIEKGVEKVKKALTGVHLLISKAEEKEGDMEAVTNAENALQEVEKEAQDLEKNMNAMGAGEESSNSE